VASLDSLIAKEAKHLEAWTLRGHAYFLNGNLFESEESYIRALRLKPGLKDQVLQERLGLVYLKRKSWRDASVVFLKCCKTGEFLPSTTAWISLGIAQMRLGETLLAEEAFTQANILDHLNPRAWGLMAVLSLQGARVMQANLCFAEAVRLGLVDAEILEEAGDLYQQHDVASAIRAYSELVRTHPESGEGWQKLADVLCGLPEERDRAIEAYKRAIVLVEGDGNKQKMALTLSELCGEERADEVEPFRQYLVTTGGDNQSMMM